MQALLNVIETGISKGREAVIDRNRNRNRIQRRRQRTSVNSNLQYLCDEPTITITTAPPLVPAPAPAPPPPQLMIYNESGDGDDETYNPRRQEVILEGGEEGGETDSERIVSNMNTCSNNRSHFLARSMEWSSLIERCEDHPLEARSESKAINESRTGNTVLHWIVSTDTSTGNQQNNSNPQQPQRPQYAVVEALLLIDPNMVNIQNEFGKLPLHLACSYRVSTDILQLLIKTNPSTINVCDNNGFSPIHILCDCGCPISSLKVLLLQQQQSTNPTTIARSTVLIKKDHIFNRTPLNILNQRKNLIMFTSYLESL